MLINTWECKKTFINMMEKREIEQRLATHEGQNFRL